MSYFSQPKATRDKNEKDPADRKAPDSPGKRAPPPEQTSNDVISRGTLVTGNIVFCGSAQIFGRVIGNIQAVQIVVSSGGQVEGNITAQEVTIDGSFKGTIRAGNVRLNGPAVIDGEVSVG